MHTHIFAYNFKKSEIILYALFGNLFFLHSLSWTLDHFSKDRHALFKTTTKK